MVLDSNLLSTRHYKVRSRVKWSNLGNGVVPSPTTRCCSYGKSSLQVTLIGFTLLYFKMAMTPLVPETKMADVSKLISLRNLLVRKVMWFVLTTTSTSLILSASFYFVCFSIMSPHNLEEQTINQTYHHKMEDQKYSPNNSIPTPSTTVANFTYFYSLRINLVRTGKI